MKIFITGASGSGTTTLGKILAHKLSIPQYDNDDIFWEQTETPFTVKRPEEDRKKILQEIIGWEQSWIFSGSALKWGELILQNADLVVRLFCDTETRIARLKLRESQRFGERILPGGDMHENHVKFIEWAEKYDTGGLNMRSRQSEEIWMRNAGCRVLELVNVDSEETAKSVVSFLNKQKACQ